MTTERTWPADRQPIVPDSADDLAVWVRQAREQAISLGGPLANHGIDFSKLQQPTDFSPGDMVITAGVGQTLEQLKATVAAKGLWLPLDSPGGGALPLADYLGADLSLSWLSHRYGTARDWVMGMTAINDTGSPVTWGAKVVKNVAGYQLAPLYIGSRHALGLMVEVTLRLIPLPADLNRVMISAANPDLLVQIWRNTVQPGNGQHYTDPWEAIRFSGRANAWQLDGLTYAPPSEIERWSRSTKDEVQLDVEPCEGIPDEIVAGNRPTSVGRFLPANLGRVISLTNLGEEELIIYPATGAALFFGDKPPEMAASIEAAGGQVVEPGGLHHRQSGQQDDDALYLHKVKSILDPEAVFGPLNENAP